MLTTCVRSSSLLVQLNLKFEIEVLCKNLSLDINELKPGNLLKDKDKLKNLEEQLSAPKKESKPPEESLPVSTAGADRVQVLPSGPELTARPSPVLPVGLLYICHVCAHQGSLFRLQLRPLRQLQAQPRVQPRGPRPPSSATTTSTCTPWQAWPHTSTSTPA